jgi:hypothetical protein
MSIRKIIREIISESIKDADRTAVTGIEDGKEAKDIRKKVGEESIQEKLKVSYEDISYREKAIVVSSKKIHPYLSDVRKGNDFIICNGKHINNLKELLVQLINMSEDVFRYHVTDYRNDFAAWIYNAVGYKELAEAIGPIKSKEKIVETIKSKIDKLDDASLL